MPDFLERIRPSARERARAARERSAELRDACAELEPAKRLRLSPTGFDLIAEVKRRAPSAGTLAGPEAAGTAGALGVARAYVDAGAAAISVLTEPVHFDGALGDLAEVSAAIEIPTLAKDFLLDPAQLYEARVSGASGALLIVRMLDDSTLHAMIEAAAETGLFLLIESFDEEDTKRARPLEELCKSHQVQSLYGINARDLDSLEIDFGRFERLRAHLPNDRPAVAESGITKPADADRVAALGYQLALVGTALMSSPTPEPLAVSILDAGRAASREASCEYA